MKIIIVTNAGKVGIGTTKSSKLTVNGDVQTFESLTVGATARQCAVDFANAGKNVSGTLPIKCLCYSKNFDNSKKCVDRTCFWCFNI